MNEEKKEKQSCDVMVKNLKEFLESKGGEQAIEELQENLTDTTIEDPLAKILVEFIGKKAKTEQQQKDLLHTICYSLIAYMTFSVLDEKMRKKQFLGEFLNKTLVKENYTGVCCKFDDKTVGVTIPKSLLKDKSEQEIIEFAKTCPEFKDLQDKEYHIMSEKELETAFNTAKLSLASFDKEKETEEKPEEDKECQTTTA